MTIDKGPTPRVDAQQSSPATSCQASTSSHPPPPPPLNGQQHNIWAARAKAVEEARERDRLRLLQMQEAQRHAQQVRPQPRSAWSPAVQQQHPVWNGNGYHPVHHHQPPPPAGPWGHPGNHHAPRPPGMIANMNGPQHAPSQHMPYPPTPQHHQSPPHIPIDPQARYQAIRAASSRPESFTGRMHHYLLQVLLPSIMPIQAEVEMLEYGRRAIESLVQDICPGGKLVPFGSLVNNLALRHSDLDLCLVLNFTPEDNTRTPRDILEFLGKRIRTEFPHLYVQYKTHARIPIIKVFARRHVGGGPGAKWNRFNADISVGNLLAIHNTRLVKAYTQVDDRFRYLVLFLKLWASRRKINEAFHGTLSSYGWALMAIHFLMHGVTAPILPNLQNIERPDTGSKEDTVEGYDVYFFNDLARLHEHFQSTNPASIGTLMRDFFIYYSDVFNYETDVISVKEANVKKEDRGWSEDKERDHNHLCIEDPFKTEYNVGRVVQSRGFELIRMEINRAKDILVTAEQTNQYVGHVYNHLLEEGEGLVKMRERKRLESNTTTIASTTASGTETTTEATTTIETTVKSKGKVQNNRPLPPSQSVQLPILEQNTFKGDDFPPLG